MNPDWLPADWRLDGAGLVHFPPALSRPPMPLADALILRDMLCTSSLDRRRAGRASPERSS